LSPGVATPASFDAPPRAAAAPQEDITASIPQPPVSPPPPAVAALISDQPVALKQSPIAPPTATPIRVQSAPQPIPLARPPPMAVDVTAAPPVRAPRAVASLSAPATPSALSVPISASTGLSIGFSADSAQLPKDAKTRLDEIARAMSSNDRLRAQIAAYAAGNADTASQARRLSLSRALAIRSYLIEKGIASTRLDVRALGNQAESGPADRVDISLAGR
jgi:outer membrane protein OmpA-like peptidoglycan-associated protein